MAAIFCVLSTNLGVGESNLSFSSDQVMESSKSYTALNLTDIVKRKFNLDNCFHLKGSLIQRNND